jgi:CRISPR-associated endonuclease/helicase Cas3
VTAGRPAVRIELFAPVASFRDPMFPGVTRCLPVPPPSTIRGLLAAAVGELGYAPPIGLAAHAEGSGTDLETYHPINSDGSNPAVAGRVAATKGGMTIRKRDFLAAVRVTVWVPDANGQRVAQAVRRPVWPLRLGRSQDVVHVTDVQMVTLYPAERATVGYAVAPDHAHELNPASTLRLATLVTPDRRETRFGTFLWCPEGGSDAALQGAWRDGEQAVWLAEP